MALWGDQVITAPRPRANVQPVQRNLGTGFCDDKGGAQRILSARERACLDARVAHLPQDQADAIIDRSASWQREHGWTAPIEGAATVRHSRAIGRRARQPSRARR